MNFGLAIEALKAGKKIARDGWNGKGMYIAMVVPCVDYAADTCAVFADIVKESTHGGDTLPIKYVETDAYLVMRTAQGTIQPGWLASQADILSDDWLIIE